MSVAELPHVLLAEAHTDALQLGFDLSPLGHGANDDALMNALAGAHVEHYLATHGVNPATPRPLSFWRDIFLGDDLDPDATFLASRDGEIAAFASLRSDGATAWEVAWFGMLPPYRVHARTLNLALKHQEVQLAQQWGIERFALEFNSTDPETIVMLNAPAGAKGAARVVTYQTGNPMIMNLAPGVPSYR